MLDIFTDLLPHVGKAILHQRNRPNDEEHNNGDRRGQAILNTAAAAFKGKLIHIAKQYVRVTCLGGGADNWRTSLDEQIDQVEVVEVEYKGSDEERSNGNQKQGQRNAAESCPARSSIDHCCLVNV